MARRRTQRPRGLKPAMAPDAVQHLHALAGIVADGHDPAAGSLALAEAAARALPGGTVYVVLGPPRVDGAAEVVAVAGRSAGAVLRGPLEDGRFELGVLTSGQAERGEVPGQPGTYFGAVQVNTLGAAPLGVLVVLAPDVPDDAVMDVLQALAALGAALLGRPAGSPTGLFSHGQGSSTPPRPRPDLEALAVTLTQQLEAGLDALPAVVSRLSEVLGALAAWCLLLDPDGGAEVAAAVGEAVQTGTPRPDRALVRRLLSRRTVARLAPDEAPMLSVPGAVELLVVPLVTQDAVQGALVFACPQPSLSPWLSVLMAEPLARAVLRSRLLDDGTAEAPDWDRALGALDSPVWITDGLHRVRKANRAARARLDGEGDEATCREVLGAHVPEACVGGEPVAAVVAAPGGRYLVRAVPLVHGGALYVALPRTDDAAMDLPTQHRRAAGELALAAVVESETPLAGLGAALASVLQDLTRGVGVRAVEERLRQVWQGVNHVQEMAGTALGYLRHAAGEPETCDPGEVLHQAVAVARARSRRAVEYHVEAGGLPHLALDRGRLLEALVGVFPERGGPVTVRARVLHDEVEIRVDGVGAVLPPATEHQVRAMGGWALADAVGGVMLRLPRRRPSAAERATLMPLAGPGSDTEIPPGMDRRARVLLVDDEPSILKSYTRLLGSRHDVVTAADGDEALDLMAQGTFDAIVTDVMMPRRNGLDLYSEVSRRWPDMVPRMVFMTGAVSGSEAEDFLRRTINRVLRKPIEGKVLRETVAEVLERTGGW